MEELCIRASGSSAGEMAGGGNREPGFPGMGDAIEAAFGGHPCAAQGLSQSTGTAHVRLNHVTMPTVHQFAKFMTGLQKLPHRHRGCGGIRQSGQSIEVVSMERSFD